MPDARRGVPTPPIEFGPDADRRQPVTARLPLPPVTVSDATLARLRSACGSVVTDPETLSEASRDWWPLAMIWALDGQVAALGAAVARPSSVEELQAVLRICAEDRIPVTTAAGRSGVCGASVPVHGGLVLDVCGLTGIVAVDHDSMVLDVRAGTFGDVLEDELRADHGVTVGHWPQSVALSTVGGWLACRGAGQYSTRYGKIEDIVVGLDVVLADGRHIRTGGAPRAAVGPDLTQLFVGSEGTLGVITSARLRLHPTPPSTRSAAWGFPSFTAGLDACRRILQRDATPAVLRLYDALEGQRNFQTGDLHPLLVLDEGDATMVDAVLAVISDECRDAVPLDAELVARWLEHRNDVSALEALIQRGFVVDTMEIAARWRDLPRSTRPRPRPCSASPGPPWRRRINHTRIVTAPASTSPSPGSPTPPSGRRTTGRHGTPARARSSSTGEPQPPPRGRAEPGSLRARGPRRRLRRARRRQGGARPAGS